MTHPISKDDMDAAIEGRGAQLSRDELDDLLQAVQEDLEELWTEYMTALEQGNLVLINEGDGTLVLADQTGDFWRVVFDRIVKFTDLLGAEQKETPETILAAHHNAAYRLSDHNWATDNPVVVGKPENFDAGQQYVEAVMNNLRTRGLSPGQAWAFYGAEIRGNTHTAWADRCGYADHSTVSEAVRKAKKAIGQ